MVFDYSTENLLGLANNIVFVEGMIILNTNKFVFCRDAICFADKEYERYATKIYRKDLNITDDNADEFSSFTIFISTGDFVSFETGEIPHDLPSLANAYCLYNESQSQFNKALDEIRDDSLELITKSLYIAPFSRFEFYLINVFMNSLHSNPGETIKAIKRFKDAVEREMPAKAMDSKKESTCKRLLRENIGQDAIGALDTIFGIKLKLPKSIKKGYAIRNSIAHRDGHDPVGKKLVIRKEDVLAISSEVDSFVKKLNELLTIKEEETRKKILKDMGLS